MRFSFIHAADLHIDSPLAALGRRNADAAARFAQAGRKAVTALIDATLNSGAACLIIAGDIFDGDWADYTTGLFFISELARLERAHIPVFMVRGNHDALSKMSRTLKWPPNVIEFAANRPESHELVGQRVLLHGRSFPDRTVPDDFVDAYPVAREGWLNIGVLHTALDGLRGHVSYAPCTEDQLRRFGYDYWALGHIHKPEVVSRHPWIVFPGNIQGRSVRETGARGAFRVSVEDGRIINAQHIALDAARWAHEHIDIAGHADEDAIFAAIHTRLGEVHAAAQGRPLALRLTLTGATPLHGALLAEHERIEAQVQADASRIADDCWVEKLRLETIAPARRAMVPHGSDAFDMETVLQEAAADSAFAEALASLANDIRGKLPRELQDDFDNLVAGESQDADAIAREAQALLYGMTKQDAAE